MDLSKLKHFCFFIGYPRSAHSVVAQCLNSRKDAVVSLEANIFKLLMKKPDIAFEEICESILLRDRMFVQNRNFNWTSYDYLIDSKFQGYFNELLLIGDKDGGNTTHRLKKDFSLLNKIKCLSPVPIKIIHAVRNPLDNISTQYVQTNNRLVNQIKKYLKSVRANNDISKKLPENEIFTLYNDELLASPRKILTDLASFVGLPRDDSWLEKCEQKLYRRESRTRVDAPWELKTVDWLLERISGIEFMEHYRDDIIEFRAQVKDGRFQMSPGAEDWRRAMDFAADGDCSSTLRLAKTAIDKGFGRGNNLGFVIVLSEMLEELDEAKRLEAEFRKRFPTLVFNRERYEEHLRKSMPKAAEKRGPRHSNI